MLGNGAHNTAELVKELNAKVLFLFTPANLLWTTNRNYYNNSTNHSIHTHTHQKQNFYCFLDVVSQLKSPLWLRLILFCCFKESPAWHRSCKSQTSLSEVVETPCVEVLVLYRVYGLFTRSCLSLFVYTRCNGFRQLINSGCSELPFMELPVCYSLACFVQKTYL